MKLGVVVARYRLYKKKSVGLKEEKIQLTEHKVSYGLIVHQRPGQAPHPQNLDAENGVRVDVHLRCNRELA